MTSYRMSLDTSAKGLLRADSNEARKYCGPLFGPQAMGMMNLLYNLVEENGGAIEVSESELAARLGVSEQRIKTAMDRLDTLQVIDFDSGDDGISELVVAAWIDPPRASWRDKNYPPALQEEFEIFVQSAERARSAIESFDNNRVAAADEPVDLSL